MNRILKITLGYILTSPIYVLLFILPYKSVHSLSKVLGRLLYCTGFRRNVVIRNLEIAFGKEKTKEEIKAICQRNYEYTVLSILTYLSIIFMPRIGSIKDFMGNINLKDNIITSFDSDRTGVYLTLHGAGFSAVRVFLHAFQKSPNYAERKSWILHASTNVFLDHRYSAAGRLTNGIVVNRYNKTFLRQLLTCFKQPNNSIILLLDQNIPTKDLFVNFFSTPVAIGRPLFELIIKNKSPVYYFESPYIDEKKQYQWKFKKIEYTITGDSEKDVHNLASLYMKAVEDFARKYPEQYFWVHKRFKTRPEGEESLY